jgi:phosphoglycerate kinase
MLKPERPMVAIVGGGQGLHQADRTGIPLKIADQLVVGGGIANTFIAAAGHNVGKSLCEHDLIDTAKKLAAETNIPVTTDVVVGAEFSESTRPPSSPSLT